MGPSRILGALAKLPDPSCQSRGPLPFRPPCLDHGVLGVGRCEGVGGNGASEPPTPHAPSWPPAELAHRRPPLWPGSLNSWFRRLSTCWSPTGRKASAGRQQSRWTARKCAEPRTAREPATTSCRPSTRTLTRCWYRWRWERKSTTSGSSRYFWTTLGPWLEWLSPRSHTQTGHAHYLEGRGPHYILTGDRELAHTVEPALQRSVGAGSNWGPHQRQGQRPANHPQVQAAWHQEMAT